jgi:hypothetical protein
MERRRIPLAVSVFVAAILAISGDSTVAQTVDVLPNEIPSGVLTPSTYRQRLDVLLNGPDNGLSRSFTITLPPEVTIVSGSATTTSDNSSLVPFIAGFPATNQIAVGLTGTMASRTVTVEFDARSPATFTGVTAGTALDTSYVFDFAADFTNNNDLDALVALNQAKPVRFITFSSPDSSIGDTTSLGGRFYKMAFPSVFGPGDAFGLPDLAHSGLTGGSASRTFTDNQTDVSFSFYVSTDSTLIKNNAGTASSLFTIGADDAPLVGQRQSPRLVPSTFIREDFTSAFGDSTEALISMVNEVDNGEVYIYVTSDLTDEWFIGRSGPLLTPHPPEFVIAGWDYDDDGGDDFNSTGLIQVASELIGGGGQKDNNDITLDSGGFMARGTAVPQVGFTPSALASIDFLFKVEDNQPGGVKVGIFLTPSGLPDRVLADLDPLATGDPDSLKESLTVSKTLTANDQLVNFEGFFRDAVTGFVDTATIFTAGEYKVYFGATDADGNKALYKVRQDPFADPSTQALLTITHSPSLQIDATQFNDFGGDGDIDVVTGIDVSQMITSMTGMNLSSGPSTQIVPISWGRGGMESALDVDDSATLDLYYSTRSDFNAIEGSVGHTSGNSDGLDLTSAVAQGNNDTHQITSGIDLTLSGQFDNLYNWDLWNFVSPEGTVPASDTRYYVYGVLTGGSTTRLVSFTDAGAINFTHPPYLAVSEPNTNLNVNVNDPVQISWSAIDVDNGHPPSEAIPAGLSAPNDRANSPNIRILLTSADFGDVTTWATVTAQPTTNPFWVGNSTDGSLTGEVELNEGVDTSFVIVGERMIDNLKGGQGLKIGIPLNVYVAIDGNGDADQPTEFEAYSPVVKAPATIMFNGSEPTTAPPVATEFIVPERLDVTVGENFQWGIIPNVAPAGTAVNVVNLFVTVDATKFTPLDVDTATAGIQPFTIGTPELVSSSLVVQGAYLDPSLTDTWRLDFRFDDSAGSGLTFFDGVRPIAIANLEASGSVGSDGIQLDGSGSRESNMLDGTLTDLDPPAVSATTVNINARATVSGKVPLQGRDDAAHPSAAQVTFFLRKPGSLTSYTDSLLDIQDEDATVDGVQITTSGVTGIYSMNNVPTGRWILTAGFPRYLTGHDTLIVPVGVTTVGNVDPVKLGDGVGTELMGGDAAGYNDDMGDSIPDNFVGSEDISAINAALFKVLGDPDYKTFADINADSVVNGTDKDMATANQTTLIMEVGKKIPILPTFKRAVNQSDNSAAVLRVTGYPEGEVKPGEMFDVTIGVEGAQSLRTYEFHLKYDPRTVTAVDLVSTGELFSDYQTDMGGKLEPGRVGLVNSILGVTRLGASGSASLATIRFQAVGRSVETEFVVTEGLLIDVDHAGTSPQTGDPITITLSKDPIVYHDADGNDILGLILADQDPIVDFNDFVAFVGAFNTVSGEPTYDFRADLNGDDAINFADFLIFSNHFGRVAVDVPPTLGRSKPAIGANPVASAALDLVEDARIGEPIRLRAKIGDSSVLQGWGMNVAFDAGLYTFVGAEITADLDDARVPLLIAKSLEDGVVSLASAAEQGQVLPVGSVDLVFAPIGDTESGVFEVLDAVVFDPQLLSNTIPRGAPLEIRAIPSAYALRQNFPNPFNPETTISYDLADAGRVELSIYNVMGQQVKQLVTEEQPAGRYRVVWDGSDAVGRGVASGIYFYRLNASGFSAVRKLMLLK